MKTPSQKSDEVQEGLGYGGKGIKLKVKTFACDWDEALLKGFKWIQKQFKKDG